LDKGNGNSLTTIEKFVNERLYKPVIKYKIRKNRMEAWPYGNAEDIDP
jgi:hypothetical protein